MKDFLVVGLILIACFAVMQVHILLKDRRLRKARATYTRDIFLADCEARGLSRDAAGATWDYLVDWQGIAFPITPTDSFTKMLNMHPDDVDDAVLDVAQKSGRKRPTTADVAGEKPVKTVEDFIGLIDRLPTMTTE